MHRFKNLKNFEFNLLLLYSLFNLITIDCYHDQTKNEWQIPMETIDWFYERFNEVLSESQSIGSDILSQTQHSSNRETGPCPVSPLLDKFIEDIIPIDFEEGQNMDIYGKVDNIEELIKRFQRLNDLKSNVSQKFDPILKRLQMRITENLMSIDLPDPCLQSMVRIAMGIKDGETWALSCKIHYCITKFIILSNQILNRYRFYALFERWNAFC